MNLKVLSSEQQAQLNLFEVEELSHAACGITVKSFALFSAAVSGFDTLRHTHMFGYPKKRL